MVLLGIIERRIYAATIVGVPLLLTMAISALYDLLMQSLPLTAEQILDMETLQLTNDSSSLSITQLTVPILLWWTPYSVQENRRKSCVGDEEEDGEVSCVVSRDRRLLAHPMTRAVFFYGTFFDMKDLPLPKRKGQDWALLHEESPKNTPVLNHAPSMRLFNHTSTFRQQSDLPLTLQHLESVDTLLEETYLQTWERKTELMSEEDLAPVVFLQSGCDNPMRREAFVEELAKHVRIDSYGGCLNNRKMPDELRGREDQDAFLRLLSKYKFVLALENAACPDYVTEKLWNALRVGSVPIYLGAPNVHEHLPNPDSAVLLGDFDSLQDLAGHVEDVGSNATAYKLMLRHKARYSSDSTELVSNKALLARLEARRYGVMSATQQLDKGNFVDAFECLVCRRATASMRLSEKGFARPIPFEASGDHYGCGCSGEAFQAMKGERWRAAGNNNVWKDLCAQSVVRSVVMESLVERGLIPKEEHVVRLLGMERVRNLVKSGDVSQADFDELKDLVRQLL